MYVHVGLHRHVRAENKEATIKSMQRFAAAMRGQPGLQQVFTLKDDATGALMGLALWDSEEAWIAARPAVLANMGTDDDEDEAEEEIQEDEAPLVYHFESV